MFIEKLNQLNKQALFVSGDVHFTEVCETPSFVKNKSLELTSSCMHSSNFVGLPLMSRSERRLASEWRLNFLICTITRMGKNLNLTTRCFSKSSSAQFKLDSVFETL